MSTDMLKIEIFSPFPIVMELVEIDQIPALVFQVSYSFECSFGGGNGQKLRCCFYEQEWFSFISHILNKSNWESKNIELKDMSGNFCLSISHDNTRHFFNLYHKIDNYCEDIRSIENHYLCKICMPINSDDFAHISNAFVEFPIRNCTQ
jgi:hypothetical protein